MIFRQTLESYSIHFHQLLINKDIFRNIYEMSYDNYQKQVTDKIWKTEKMN